MRTPYAVQLIRDSIKFNLSRKTVLGELKYWYIKRQTRKFIPWLARKLPESLKYYVVIHGMVTVEPRNNPSEVMGTQMLELWKKGAEKVG